MVDEENKIIAVDENITHNFESLSVSNKYAQSYTEVVDAYKSNKIEN